MHSPKLGGVTFTLVKKRENDHGDTNNPVTNCALEVPAPVLNPDLCATAILARPDYDYERGLSARGLTQCNKLLLSKLQFDSKVAIMCRAWRGSIVYKL